MLRPTVSSPADLSRVTLIIALYDRELFSRDALLGTALVRRWLKLT